LNPLGFDRIDGEWVFAGLARRSWRILCQKPTWGKAFCWVSYGKYRTILLSAGR
jgi:hypothetical protein